MWVVEISRPMVRGSDSSTLVWNLRYYNLAILITFCEPLMSYENIRENNMTSSKTKDLVLVTGGTGLVGRSLEDEVNYSDDEHVKSLEFKFIGSKDGDLTDSKQVEKIFNTYKPSYVIHLAAHVGGLFANMENNLKFYRINSSMNDNVLLFSSEYRVKKCISCLSTCIFPNDTPYPINEKMIHDGPPHDSNFGYSYAKRMIDVLNRAYNLDQISRPIEDRSLFTAVIPCNIYGMYDNFDINQGHVVPGLIHKAYKAMRESEQNLKHDTYLTVYGSGRPVRQFLYSKDLAKLLLWSLKNYDEPEPIIICVDESDEITIKELAIKILSSFEDLYKENEIKHGDVKLVFDSVYSDGQQRKTASNEKLRGYLPKYQFTPIDIGIKETVRHFYSSAIMKR